MFWGLVMEPYKRYSQKVLHTFHLSMACLDVSKSEREVVQVMLFYEGKNYLLCNLSKESTWQVPLDITLEENSEIAFACNGNGHVHLTGYLIPTPENIYEEHIEADSYQKKNKLDKFSVMNDHNPKRKATDSPKSQKQTKRVKQETEDSSDDDDDENIETDEISEDDDTEDSKDEDIFLDDEQEEDDSEEDEEDDEDDEEEDDNEEEIQEYKQKKMIKSQQHDKKNKQTQEQQKEQNKKQDKQKAVNGKEIKQEQQKQQKKNKAEQQQQQQQQNVQNKVKKTVEGGVQVEDLKVGQGSPVKLGRFVSVYYVGRLKNGKKFDATTQGEGFKFHLGKGDVIKGWDVGIVGMKIGGKRRLTIPPNMAYGARGSPPLIPGNSTLVFDVELKKVH